MDFYNMKLEIFNSLSHQNFRLIFGTENFNAPLPQSTTTPKEAPTKESQTPFGFKYKSTSLRRTKRTLFKLIRHNFGKNMKRLTMTYKFGHTNRHKVYKDIENCAMRYKKIFNTPLNYIAVLEYHKTDHGLHVHLIVDIPFIDIKEFAAKIWQQGFCWINSMREKGVSAGSHSLSNYILKYIEKDFELVPARQRRYTKSQTWATDWSIQYFQDQEYLRLMREMEPWLKEKNIYAHFFSHTFSESQIVWVYDIYPSMKNIGLWHDFFVSFIPERKKVFHI